MAILKRKPKAKIKQFLIDQQNIAGIGNIYSDEILFFSKVHPLRKIIDLKPEEIKKIFKGIKKILAGALKFQGSSIDLYLNALGEKGEYVPYLSVLDALFNVGPDKTGDLIKDGTLEWHTWETMVSLRKDSPENKH